MTQTTEQTAQSLERMAELFESGWCQEAYARNDWGRSLGPDELFESDADPVSFCLQGGLLKVMHDDTSASKAKVRKALADTLGIRRCELMDWNDVDGRTKKDVVCLCLDAANSLRG